MATGTLVSVEEYLSTSYSPDCDYVDGQLLERNVGETDHSRLQFLLGLYIGVREKQWGVVGYTEQRVQVTPTRYRISDICFVIAPAPDAPILYGPPFLCIEILSPDDRYAAMQEKLDDYLKFGVKYIGVIDLKTRNAHIYSETGVTEAKDGVLCTSNPDIRVPLSEL